MKINTKKQQRNKRKSEGTDTFSQVEKEAKELLKKALAGDVKAIIRIWEIVDGKPEENRPY